MHAEVLRADDPVVLPHLGSIGPLWSAVVDVADHRAHGWTLIGALMVMLHEHEAGTPTRAATADADAVVDVGLLQPLRRLRDYADVGLGSSLRGV